MGVNGELKFATICQLLNEFAAKGLYERDDKVMAKVICACDKNQDDRYNFEEFLRIHIALKVSKQIAEEYQAPMMMQHAAVFVCADKNYGGNISIAEIKAMYKLLYPQENVDKIDRIVQEMQLRDLDLDHFVAVCRQFEDAINEKVVEENVE